MYYLTQLLKLFRYVATNLCTFYSYMLYIITMIINYKWFIVSTDEWKKQLAAHLIDYNLLDIKETIASGV